VTNFLILVNVLVFCAEVVWQSMPGHQGMSFLNAGGLFAPRVLAGEWWRIVTANFLHLGIIHLLLNMLGLMYLGEFVETRLGTFRFTIAYIIAGLGSMLAITYVDTYLLKTPIVTVGASGAIMGLLGTMGAIHLLDWQGGKARSAAREFRVVLFSVGFQLVFDLANGHTSITGHFSGLIIGFLVGLLLCVGGRD
jgi:rhomboid protease GluP